MATLYSTNLKLMHALCLAETNATPQAALSNLDQYDALNAADYLSCYITFKAIQAAERSPASERSENFDMLNVYQAYAMLVYAFLSMPLAQEDISPNPHAAQVTIAKTLFAGLPDTELLEIIEVGYNKFQLIGDAEAEHWTEFRENLDKLTIAFIIAGTDDDAPHSAEEVLPMFGQLLSQLCEAFENV